MELAADEEAKQGASSDPLEPAANNHPTDGEQSASASYELEQAAYAPAASATNNGKQRATTINDVGQAVHAPAVRTIAGGQQDDDAPDLVQFLMTQMRTLQSQVQQLQTDNQALRARVDELEDDVDVLEGHAKPSGGSSSHSNASRCAEMLLYPHRLADERLLRSVLLTRRAPYGDQAADAEGAQEAADRPGRDQGGRPQLRRGQGRRLLLRRRQGGRVLVRAGAARRVQPVRGARGGLAVARAAPRGLRGRGAAGGVLHGR